MLVAIFRKGDSVVKISSSIFEIHWNRSKECIYGFSLWIWTYFSFV